MNNSLTNLIDNIPDTISTFKDSEYLLPINLALYGQISNISEIKEEAITLSQIDLTDESNPPREKEVEKILHLAIALGEHVEASMSDKQDYFISDAKFRRQTFRVKRSPGWVLVLGNADQTELINRLHEKKFIVFSTFSHPKATYLGNRPTSSVYFFQNQMRYAMVYGQIEQGDPHTMGHFLEDDGPGIIIVNGTLSDVEALLTLGGMLLGAPAIVPSSFPYQYGNRRIADSLDVILDEAIRFPNLRVIERDGVTYELPSYCDPANLSEKVEVANILGNSPLSFFTVQQADIEDGIEVIGNLNAHLGILIELNYQGMNEVATELLEELAVTFPNYIKGVSTTLSPDEKRKAAAIVADFKLGVAKDITLTGEMLAQTIHDGLIKRYPVLDKVKVTVISDETLLKQKSPEINAYKSERAELISKYTEETMTEFYSCVSCQPFAREHACVITPERLPQCGRDWRLALVGAYLNPEDAPDQLSQYRKRRASNVFGILQKGKLIDPLTGEWSGINAGIERESGGKIKRVQIHSITGDIPHSSCGCFGYLAFYMPEIDGIGIMKKTYKGKAPNGMTWDLLANRAGGKQQPNITGLSLGYLKSPKFLQGDGGFRRVVWMDHKTHSELNNIIPPQIRIATDNDVRNMDQLRNFLKSTSK